MLTFINKIYTNCAWYMHQFLLLKGLFLKQSDFYNQKLRAHPQWESNPRPLGDLQECLATKLWEWHFQLHDLEYLFCWCRYFVSKFQHTKMLITNQAFAVAPVFCCWRFVLESLEFSCIALTNQKKSSANTCISNYSINYHHHADFPWLPHRSRNGQTFHWFSYKSNQTLK